MSQIYSSSQQDLFFLNVALKFEHYELFEKWAKMLNNTFNFSKFPVYTILGGALSVCTYINVCLYV